MRLDAEAPSAHLLFWGCGAVGSARDWQSRGQGFESPQLHQNRKRDPASGPAFSFRPAPLPSGPAIAPLIIQVLGDCIGLIGHPAWPPTPVHSTPPLDPVRNIRWVRRRLAPLPLPSVSTGSPVHNGGGHPPPCPTGRALAVRPASSGERWPRQKPPGTDGRETSDGPIPGDTPLPRHPARTPGG